MSVQRLSWLDWRGRIDLDGWWSTGGIVLAGTLAAVPDITLDTLLALVTLVVAADPLLGGLWSGVHTLDDGGSATESGGSRSRLHVTLANRPLLPTWLRLVWAPVLATALAYLVHPAAALVAGTMVLVTFATVWTSLTLRATPRAIVAVGLPWLLGYVAFQGDLRVWPLWGLLVLAVVGARDLFTPQKLLGAVALPLVGGLLLFARAPVGAVLVWVLWTITLLFRVQRAARGGSWYLRHAQTYFVLAIVAASWALHV